MSSPRLYSRVRVTKAREDTERLLPLLYEYLDYPERAESVTEFVFRCNTRRLFMTRHVNEDLLEKIVKEDEASHPERHSKLCSALQRLGLNETEQREWIGQMAWLKPELALERQWELYQYHGSAQHARSALHTGTLLMSLCPNIAKIVYEDSQGTVVSSVLMRNNYGKLPIAILQKLKTLVLAPNDDDLMDERPYSDMDVLETLRLFHRLPSLEEVSLAITSVDGDVGYTQWFPSASSNVKRIRLLHTMLPADIYGPLIRMSKGLECLTYVEGAEEAMDGGFWHHYPKLMAQCLGCYKATLRELHLDVDHRFDTSKPLGGDFPEEGEELGNLFGEEDEFSGQDRAEASLPLHSWELKDPQDFQGVLDLHDFEKLTRLSIGVRYLLGSPYVREFDKMPTPKPLVDRLPPHLQFLLIRGYKKGKWEIYDREIEKFMEDKPARFQALAEIQGIDTFLTGTGYIGGEDGDEYYMVDTQWKPSRAEEGWLEMSAGTTPEDEAHIHGVELPHRRASAAGR